MRHVECYSYKRTVNNAGPGWWAHLYEDDLLLASYEFYKVVTNLLFGWAHKKHRRIFMRFDLRNGQWVYAQVLTFYSDGRCINRIVVDFNE